ncbi:uncharacterized protein [Panulirus ornatus]|uniref:uncharacterized protein n=1 Tax=Panulirus ornatus TaxID=150431 RepID=UPI003A83531A
MSNAPRPLSVRPAAAAVEVSSKHYRCTTSLCIDNSKVYHRSVVLYIYQQKCWSVSVSQMPPYTTAPTQNHDGEGVQDISKVTSQMVRDLYSDNVEDQLEATRQFRQLVSLSVNASMKELIDNVSEVIDSVSVARFVQLLQDENNCQLQNEAAWVLCNIASSISPHTQAVVSAGAVPILIHLISSSSPDVRQTAAWTLGNIAGDCLSYRDLVLAQNILTPLLQMLEKRPDAPVAVLSWVIRNLFGRHDPPHDFNKVAPCLPAVCRLIFHSEDEVSNDACWVLINLSRGYGHQLQAALDPAFCRRLDDLHREKPCRKEIAEVVQAVSSKKPDNSTETKANGNLRTGNDHKQHALCPASAQMAIQATPRRMSLGSISSQTIGKRRSRSPSPAGVSTRNTPKRFRTTLLFDVSTNTPVKHRAVKTRASAKKLMTSPDHSASHISQKTAEIFKAVEVGDVERVEKLVQDIGPAVTRVKTGCTLLHAAASNNQPDVVLFLLKLISPNVVNKEGQTPAHLAAMKGHTQVLRILLADQQLKHDKRDNCHRTYKDLVCA